MENTRLTGLTIAVIGGDERDVVLAEELANLSANVWLCGFDRYEKAISKRIEMGLPEKADAIILPLPGIAQDNSIYAAFAASKIDVCQIRPLLVPGVFLICGHLSEDVHRNFVELGISVLQANNLDELAIHNAVPTAEGAVAYAMNNSPLTIQGSKALVCGFGRCGAPLARTLKALGADVTVAARKREVLSDAHIQGFHTVYFSELKDHIIQFDFIFNTVPSMVLDKSMLMCVQKDVLIIDIASAPGGVDFTAAKELSLSASILPGLPGKIAPVSAGKILARIYPHYLTLHTKGGKQK